ncbi:MAG TPA: oxidoreductase [Terriglobales bacterium]|nr:oxidoreductase [Terriglobales bacterium]
MSKVWFVTGATRGIGSEIAKAALAAGDKVVATGRNPEAVRKALGTTEYLFVTALDVTNEDQVETAIRTAVERFGGIDVLVNNAGYGQLGVFEESTPQQIRAQYDANVFGLMAVTRAVLPIMRKQRSGRILNISSIAGRRGIFGGSIYNSSKFAVEGFSQCIAQELAPLGIYVTAISPGFFRTDFLDGSSVQYAEEKISDYTKGAAEFRAFMDNRNHEQAGDPAKLAKAIIKLADVEKPPVSFVAGSDAVEMAMDAITAQKAQIESWRDLSVSTDGTWSETLRQAG